MKAPAWWWLERPTLAARLLQPCGAAYGAVTAARMARPGTRMPVPVVCVGNPTAGGAGKTPVALAIAEMLVAYGRRPAFLSRGYGRRASAGEGLQRVDPTRHTAAEVGDEPLLLAAVAPTFVAADRAAAAKAAVAAGADVLVMDDGLQNPDLCKDWTVAVVDGASGFGNGLCVPAGPLRAPLARQWPAVSCVVVIGDGAAGRRAAALASAAGKPVMGAKLEPDPAALAALAGGPVLAFAGIGRPAKFFDTLRDAGLTVAATRSFPDHHPFGAADRDGLERAASAAGAVLVTTAKDRVRLPADFPARALPVSLRFDDPAAIAALMLRAVNRARAG